jgi:dTDP-4-dehydrorhamnose 3,5-epimerase-like enzyme
MLIEKLIQFNLHEDSNGTLCAYESCNLVPFTIKRIFTVTAKAFEIRGNHAHKKCTQLLVSVTGEIEVTCDNGIEKSVYKLSSMGQGLLIPAGIWASEKYICKGSVLMVLCDRDYESDDYIRDYDDFKEYIIK